MYKPRGCVVCPRVSDAVRVGPIRGLSEPVAPCRPAMLAPGRSRSSRGGRAARTEADRPVPPRLVVEELLVLALSASGGGVGGNMLRFNGGSECCRLRPTKLFWIKFVAP